MKERMGPSASIDAGVRSALSGASCRSTIAPSASPRTTRRTTLRGVVATPSLPRTDQPTRTSSSAAAALAMRGLIVPRGGDRASDGGRSGPRRSPPRARCPRGWPPLGETPEAGRAGSHARRACVRARRSGPRARGISPPSRRARRTSRARPIGRARRARAPYASDGGRRRT